MNETERTTIRIKKHLINQSRDIAYQQGKSLQEVINMLLEKGLKDISNLHKRKNALKRTDILREKLKGYDTDFSDILDENKKDQR